MKKALFLSLILISLSILLFSGSSAGKADSSSLWPRRSRDIKKSNVKGFGILYRIPGQWNGPVTSDTPAGNFPRWYVDFRPVSATQISQLSTVDPSMCNWITFFIVRHEGRLKVAMRTDATFRNKGCITYEVMDKVNEAKGYYRFSDFQSGSRRAYTEFRFSGKRLEMKVYTNKFNRLKNLTLHSTWKARRVTMKSSAPAIRHFSYPRPRMTKNFSKVFGNRHESIFYDRKEDPYPSKDEPYVGSATFDIAIDTRLKVSKSDELFLMLTTKPIFENMKYLPERLNYISKMIYLPISTREYTLTHIHPGIYYLYSYNDRNGDRRHKRGDYMSADFLHKITIQPGKDTAVKTYINFVIP